MSHFYDCLLRNVSWSILNRKRYIYVVKNYLVMPSLPFQLWTYKCYKASVVPYWISLPVVLWLHYVSPLEMNSSIVQGLNGSPFVDWQYKYSTVDSFRDIRRSTDRRTNKRTNNRNPGGLVVQQLRLIKESQHHAWKNKAPIMWSLKLSTHPETTSKEEHNSKETNSTISARSQ